MGDKFNSFPTIKPSNSIRFYFQKLNICPIHCIVEKLKAKTAEFPINNKQFSSNYFKINQNDNFVFIEKITKEPI